MKRIALLQSNYIPWKGYFDIINYVDEFIIYDDAQYTRRDWRNRNLIKTRQGLKWLTIPVLVKGRFTQSIRETKIASDNWADKHWESLRHNYKNADYFKNFEDKFEKAYNRASEMEYLSDVNLLFIEIINSLMNIQTIISESSEYELRKERNEKIISICRQSGADIYVTGPAAKQYIDIDLFKEARIDIEYFYYDNYPRYNQLYGTFIHNVSIIDMIFNTGKQAYTYLKSAS